MCILVCFFPNVISFVSTPSREQPLLSSEEMERTRKIVEKFGIAGGVGEKLQKQLEERAKTHDNWASALCVCVCLHPSMCVWLLVSEFGGPPVLVNKLDLKCGIPLCSCSFLSVVYFCGGPIAG